MDTSASSATDTAATDHMNMSSVIGDKDPVITTAATVDLSSSNDGAVAVTTLDSSKDAGDLNTSSSSTGPAATMELNNSLITRILNESSSSSMPLPSAGDTSTDAGGVADISNDSVVPDSPSRRARNKLNSSPRRSPRGRLYAEQRASPSDESGGCAEALALAKDTTITAN